MTSEMIIEKLLHKNKISVKEAMTLMKDCVIKEQNKVPDYGRMFGDYPLKSSPTMTTTTSSGLLDLDQMIQINDTTTAGISSNITY